jgi:hypothetical protein
VKAGRPLWWAAGLSLCLVVVAAIVVLLVRGGEHRVEVTTNPRPDRSERAVLAAEALQRLERVVTSGQTPGGDDPVATAAANAKALRVSDFTVRYVDEDAGALSAGSDEWVAAVDTTWAFRGFDRDLAQSEVTFTFRQDGEHATIVGIGGGDRRTPLWLAGPVTVRRAPGVLVVAAGGAQAAKRYFGLATRAVTVVHRVEPDWHNGLVVEVPGSVDQLDAELDAQPEEYAQIAAVTTTVDGSLAPNAPVHVFVNPQVFGPLAAQGAQVVMSHEATHVATGAATASMPLWLVEGFADYVALRDVDLPLSVTAAQIAAQVRQHGLPRALPTDEEFDTTTTHLGASYEAAWLACRTLAELGGERELVTFYDGVQAGGTEPVEMQRIFGFSEAELTRTWRSRLRALAR